MIGVFVVSLLVGFSGAVVPGPLFAFTLSQSLVSGWAAGFWLAFGHMLAEGALVLILRAGLGGLLRRPLTTKLIGVIGGGVLLYFAWGMVAVLFQHDLGVHTAARASSMSGGMLIWQGVLLTVVNPYWYLWWATAGVGLIGSQASTHGSRAWPVFFCGHSMADYLWYVAVSVILALSGAFLSPFVHRLMIFIAGLGVAFLGGMFIYRAITACLHDRAILAAGD